MKQMKKFLSLFVAFAMAFSTMPNVALAENSGGGTNSKEINLTLGETVTIVDENGNYSNEELEGLNSDIATVTVKGATYEETTAQIGESVSSNVVIYPEEKRIENLRELSEFLYTPTFGNESEDGDWKYIECSSLSAIAISTRQVAEDGTVSGTTTYFDSNGGTLPHWNTAASDFQIRSKKEGVFSFFRKAGGGRYAAWLYFNANNLSWDAQTSYPGETSDFEIYVKDTDNSGENSLIPGYKKINSITELKQVTSEILIAKKVGDTYYCVAPAIARTDLKEPKNRHIARLTLAPENTNRTEITITATSDVTKAGKTSVTIGGTTYNINVNVKNIFVEVGQSKTVTGFLREQPENDVYADIQIGKDETPYDCSAGIESGKLYYISAAGKAMSYGSTMQANSTNYKGFKLINNFEKETLWKIIGNSSEGYTIQTNFEYTYTGDDETAATVTPGKYITMGNLSGGGASLTLEEGKQDSTQRFRIAKFNNGTSIGNIAYSNANFNNYSGQNTKIAIWQGEPSQLYLYRPNVTVTGREVGQTTVIIDDVVHNIIVVDGKQDIVLEVGGSEVIEGTTTITSEMKNDPYISAELYGVTGKSPLSGDIVSGERYFIGTLNKAMTSKSETRGAADTSEGLALSNSNPFSENNLWRITKNETGKYAIQVAHGEDAGKYITVNGKVVKVAECEEPIYPFVITKSGNNFTFEYSSNNSENIDYEFNNYGESETKVAGWSKSDTNPWLYIYQPTYSAVKITAEKAGNTSIVIDNILYNITIVDEKLELEQGQSFTAAGTTDSVSAEQGTTYTVEDISYGKITGTSVLGNGNYFLGLPASEGKVLLATNRVDNSSLDFTDGTVVEEGMDTSACLWTITKSGEGYTFQDTNGYYLNKAESTSAVANLTVAQGNEAQLFYMMQAPYNDTTSDAFGIANKSEDSDTTFYFNKDTATQKWHTYRGHNGNDASGNLDKFYFYGANNTVKITLPELTGDTPAIMQVGDKTYAVTVTACTHKIQKLVNVKESTCAEEGWTGDYACANEGCNNYVVTPGQAISKTAHIYNEAWTTEGDYHWHTCTNTNCDSKDSYETHTWVEQSVTENMEITYGCKCGETKTEVNTILTAACLTNKEKVDATLIGNGNYRIGDKVTLTAPVIPGKTFLGWYEGTIQIDENNVSTVSEIGTRVSGKRTYTVQVTGTAHYVAQYETVNTNAAVTLENGNGVSYKVTYIENNTTTDRVSGTYGEESISCQIGDTVTLTAGKDCAGWQNEYGVYVARKPEYTFTITGDITLTPVFNTVSENEILVIYESAYRQELDRNELTTETITENETEKNVLVDDPTVPEIPARYGYKAKGWRIENTETIVTATEGNTIDANVKAAIEELLENDIEVVRFIAEYTVDDTQKCTVTVKNGELEAEQATEYYLSQVVTVVAEKVTNKEFSHWIDEKGNIMSYNETYSFYAVTDVKLTAVYVNTEAEKPTPVGITELLQVKKETDANTGYDTMTFVSLSTVPKGYTIHKAGVIVALESYLTQQGATELTDKTAQRIVGDSWTGTSYRYTYTVKKQTDAAVYARAYLVYSDADGDMFTVYGDVVKQ